MAVTEIVQKTKITFSQKEALFKLEVKSVLSNFLTDIIRPATRVLGWEDEFNENQKNYDKEIIQEYLKDIKQR
jgi:hypothetical protein